MFSSLFIIHQLYIKWRHLINQNLLLYRNNVLTRVGDYPGKDGAVVLKVVYRENGAGGALWRRGGGANGTLWRRGGGANGVLQIFRIIKIYTYIFFLSYVYTKHYLFFLLKDAHFYHFRQYMVYLFVFSYLEPTEFCRFSELSRYIYFFFSYVYTKHYSFFLLKDAHFYHFRQYMVYLFVFLSKA